MNIVKVLGGVVVIGFVAFNFVKERAQDKVLEFNDATIESMDVGTADFTFLSNKIYSWDGSKPFDGQPFQQSIDRLRAEQENAKNSIKSFEAKEHELVDRMRSAAVEYMDSNLRLVDILEEMGKKASEEGATPDSLDAEIHQKYQSECEFNVELHSKISLAQRDLANEFEFELR